jgi:cell wall-associated NlpC family hydrolase
MGLFKKNPDPITDRSRELNAKISALESKIQKLSQELQPGAGPRLRSTAYPGDTTAPIPHSVARPRNSEPIFEKVDQNQLKAPAEPSATAPHVNELGVRKYDLWSLWERIKKEFQSPPAANPKLVNYLAAGSIQGLRPLRFEKRVQRNRFVALATLFLLACLGILSYALQHRHH